MRKLIISLALVVIAGCSSGGGDSEKMQDGFVDLRIDPVASDNMNFSESETGTLYSESSRTRKIIQTGAFMDFTFTGKKEFRLNALGSTIEGISYSYLDIYVNSERYKQAVYLTDPAQINVIPEGEFKDGVNKVSIELVKGPNEERISHAWVYEAATYTN